MSNIGAKVTKRSVEQDYPVLMKAKSNSMVVLMTSRGVGTVVMPNEHNDVGYHIKGWDEDCFVRFYGTIELEGK